MHILRTLTLIISTVVLCTGCGTTDNSGFRITSPDGTLSVVIDASDTLTYKVFRHGEPLLSKSAIGMEFADGHVLGRSVTAVKAGRNEVNRTIKAPFYRQAEFNEHYNQLRIEFNDGCAVTFRVYDEGCAYRFETSFGGETTVTNEIAEFDFAGEPQYLAAYSDGLCNAFQFQYTPCTNDDIRTDKPIILPLAVDCGAAGKVLICESDLEAYPGMFLTPADGKLCGMFASVPDTLIPNERRCQLKVMSRHDYIARTAGTRTYPWRILAVADDDTQLPVNNMVYSLGAENRIGDTSWIRPGKAAWEWWNDWGLTGTDFKPGINNPTYKAYIDFAAKYGLQYVVLDEGWYDPKGGDVMAPIDAVNLPELTAYAAERNVGLLLWVVSNVLDDKLEEACAHYSAMGIKGFKVDFIDRDDQLAVETVYRLAEATASHRLLLDLHGIYKPTGLNRTYPNVINFEGVVGLEELKWSNPDMPKYDVTFPFIRMVQGPVDYTPGSYRNATREGFQIDYYKPMSQGTRAHQVATYVVFDAPLSMLCDSPSLYDADEPCTRFIALLPTVFERTEILAGKIGEYIITARKSGERWYVGGLTDWTPRTLSLDMSFLGSGRYHATMLHDDSDSDTAPEKYVIKDGMLNSTESFDITLAPGGGFAIIIEPAE